MYKINSVVTKVHGNKGKRVEEKACFRCLHQIAF